jgi:hypothetical protein
MSKQTYEKPRTGKRVESIIYGSGSVLRRLSDRPVARGGRHGIIPLHQSETIVDSTSLVASVAQLDRASDYGSEG